MSQSGRPFDTSTDDSATMAMVARGRRVLLRVEPVAHLIVVTVLAVGVLRGTDPAWLAPAIVVIGAMSVRGLFGPLAQPWNVVRGLLGIGVVVVVSLADADRALQVMPIVTFIGVASPLVMGMRWSVPNVVAAAAAVLAVSGHYHGAVVGFSRAVPLLLGGLVVGIVSDSITVAAAVAERQRSEAGRLAREQALFRALLSEAPAGVLLVDEQHTRLFVNDTLAEMTGRTNEDLLERGLRPSVHPGDIEAYVEASTAADRGDRFAGTVRMMGPDGLFLVDTAIVPSHDPAGRFVGAVAMFIDVTAQHAARRSLERFRSIADGTSDIVAVSDLDGRILYMNARAREFAGVADDAVERFDPFSVTSEETTRWFRREVVSTVIASGTWAGELIDRDGCVVPMSAVVTAVADDDGSVEAIAVSYRDLTERRRLERRLAEAALHDALTGLPNRSKLRDHLADELTGGHRPHLLFFDLDDFKVVNDSHGHDVGDVVLRHVATRLVAACGPEHLVARLGGDEFVVVTPRTASASDALALAAEVHDRVRQPIEVDDKEFVVTVSVGIARGTDCASPEELVRNADIAMYRAKRDGRRRTVVFDPSMHDEVVERQQLERDLRTALDSGEIVIHLQPICDLDTGEIIAFEALLRWNHPTRGLLAPAVFLPLVEELGLDQAVCTQVIEQSVSAAAALRRIAPVVRVGFNVTPTELLRGRVLTTLRRSAGDAGVPLNAFAIELTEHALMADASRASSILNELRDAGVLIAVDDFGTGYSNLASLHLFAIDYLKIDRSFVDGLGDDVSDSQIVRMVLTLAREMGLEAIAEGIETERQATELRRLGCGLGQGFWLAQPMTVDSAADLLVGNLASLRRATTGPA